jgi:hypothetical protein
VDTTISVPEETLHRADDAARRLGVSRSEFFAQAAERWIKALDDDTTATITGVLAGLPADHAFHRRRSVCPSQGRPRLTRPGAPAPRRATRPAPSFVAEASTSALGGRGAGSG